MRVPRSLPVSLSATCLHIIYLVLKCESGESGWLWAQKRERERESALSSINLSHIPVIPQYYPFLLSLPYAYYHFHCHSLCFPKRQFWFTVMNSIFLLLLALFPSNTSTTPHFFSSSASYPILHLHIFTFPEVPATYIL